MIADMLSYKKFNPIVTELLIRGRKLNLSFLFITQYYFAISKHFRVISSQYFFMKILNKQQIQQIAFNHLPNIDLKDVINLYKNCIAKFYSFLVIDIPLASENLLRLRKNLLE